MSRSGFRVFGLVVLAACAALLGVARCEGTPPQIGAPASLAVGKQGRTVTLEVGDDGAGLRVVTAVLVHAGGEAALGEHRFGGRWRLFGGAAQPERIELAIDPKALALKDGEATLRVTARDHAWRSWLSGNEARAAIPVALDFRAPRVSLAPGIHYARRGGSVPLVYEVSEPTERDGVEVGERFFAGVQLGQDAGRVAPGPPGHGTGKTRGPGPRLALFALPIDAPDARPAVVAFDAAGNRARAVPQVRIAERALPEAQLPLSKIFLDEKIGELADAVGVDASDRVKAFQEINTRIRAENERRIREVVAGSAGEPLFQGAFEQLANSKVTSPFAERRSYTVGGKKVSESVHYGYDLASLAGSPVTAGNAGRVVFAEELGIYGQCVILDHGLGLATLYGHLSSIDVQQGDRVEKGQTLGLSGQTGLAGGDHLHFAMLLNGVYVDPVEWWDPKWVREHFEDTLVAGRR